MTDPDDRIAATSNPLHTRNGDQRLKAMASPQARPPNANVLGNTRSSYVGCPTDHLNRARVSSVHHSTRFRLRPDWATVFRCCRHDASAKKSGRGRTWALCTICQRTGTCCSAREAPMSRKLVWVEQAQFRGFGCSECGWRFEPSGDPSAGTLTEMIRAFKSQREDEFAAHVCAAHPKRS